MIKELKYGGYSASPDDHDSLEGDLAVAMNLIPEDNTIKPVLPPKVIASIPGDPNLPSDKGRKIVCIHQTSAFKHFIIAIEFDGLSPQHPPYTYLYRWDGTEGGGLVRLGYKAFNEVYKVEPIGNTLVVLTDTGIHYYLWKNGVYQYLGTHLPELDIQFYLYNHDRVFSDTHEVNLKVDGSTPSHNTITNNKELSHALRQAIMASANQAVAKAVKGKHFVFPFFVRYAFRMYDGDSITMHSAPMLMIPARDMPKVWKGFTLDSNGFVKEPYTTNTVAEVDAYDIMYRVIDSGQLAALGDWKDIVTGIDVFISPQFFTYNQAADDEKIDMFNEPHLEKKDISRDVCDNGSFFLAASMSLQKIESVPAGVLSIDFETSNENIVVRDRMTDDYGTHDGLIAEQSFAYNNRINLASVSKKLFSGFNPLCFWWGVANNNVSFHETTHYVVVNEDGREIVLQSPSALVTYDNDEIVWFFYPNPNAKRAYVLMDDSIVELQLKPHAMLNGAYFCSLEEDAVRQSVDSIPTPSSDEERIVSMPNKTYTSEVNNPFYFPKLGINSISAGNIMGLCAAVRPVSTSQFGYADLYIFADNGVWVAKINDKGAYSNIDLATGDVCINPDSITQMETSVLFTTDRGIMLLSGSKAQCISEQIDDKGQVSPGLQDITTNLADMMEILVEVDYFDTFLQGCRMLYDYKGQRIIAYNPDYSYAYIYSLESNKWGMAGSDIKYTVNSYPDALAVIEDDKMDKLVNYSEPCSAEDSAEAVDIGQLLLTRPLTLDQPDIIKTVTAVLQRGMFRKRMRHVQCVLYGSRDLYNWRAVSSSQDENIRGYGGTGYKWFRVGLLLHLERGESITGCTVEFNQKQTNRLR